MNTSSAKRLVLVVPCYNEAERLPLFLPGLTEALADIDCLIQVVDDGSQPAQVKAVEAAVEKSRSRLPNQVASLLALPVNQGKGAAIRAGWRAHGESELLGFVDADGAIAPREVRRFAELAFAAPGQAYFASRIKMLGRKVDRKFTRHIIGRVFATLVSLRLKVPVYDTQCGLKILPSAAFPQGVHFEENGFAFDLELMMVLLDEGFSIEEVPIDWSDVPGSKVHLVRDPIRMYSALQRIAHNRSKRMAPDKIK